MLRGHKINIRPMRNDDLELFYLWNTEQEYMGDYMGAGMYYKDLYIEGLRKSLSDHKSMLAIIEDKDNKPLGLISCHTLRNIDSVAELGMQLPYSDTRGKGIGGEALRLFTDYLFNIRSFVRVQYQTRVDNAAMRRIGEKAGYTVEGVLRNYLYDQGQYRDYYMIAMTKEDWLAKQTKI